MAQNRTAAKYEYEFYSRCMMFCSSFRQEYQDGEDVIEDLEGYLEQKFNKPDSTNAFTLTAMTAFVDLLRDGSLCGTKQT